MTEEYAEIHDSLNELTRQVNAVRERQTDIPETVRKVLREETGSLQNRWLIGAGSLFLGFLGVGLSVSSNAATWDFLKQHGIWIGLALIGAAAVALAVISRQK